MTRTADELQAQIADRLHELMRDELEVVDRLIEGLFGVCERRFADGRELGRAEPRETARAS